MEQLVIIGNGMAGVACLENILSHKKKFDITIFGDETHVNYNRIMLSSVLAGERTADEITINGIDWYQKNGIGLRLGVRIIAVNTTLRTITGDDGSVTRYDKLIFATGSSAFIPKIDGVCRRNVFTFRNMDDTRGLLQAAGKGRRAVVIGGGLLGLEAARGLQMQGCDVTVVHIVDTLMNNQLDSTAGDYVKRKMEELGIEVLGGKRTTAILGRDEVEAVELSDGSRLPADLVVIAAGIRPNADLARHAGIQCGKGIIVNDYMETSDRSVFAVGECTEHNGETFGLVAPLFDQGKVLAATITGNKEPVFQGWQPAAKLKVMGVEVFSAGEFQDKPGLDVVRYEDERSGVYKKLLVHNNRLVGCVLVGDTADSNRYMEWLRSKTDLEVRRRNLLFPEPVADKGESIAEIPDSETICGCMGVTKGKLIKAIHENGIRTMPHLKECTRASTGCGSCAGVCQGLLKAVAPDFEEETKKVLCKCLPFSQDNLREIIQTQEIKSVQEVLDIYGDGIGCEICKPALSYLVDVVWCGDHDEDRSARFINDRVHANIQNDGTFSVVPRMRGGVTTPAELRKIADVAEKYKVPLVKVTGSQRIDLLGVKKSDLPKMWSDLGMPSGQAYAKGLRMVKTCVGTEFCRFGVQDAMGTGIELERRLENLFTPHKTKLGVTGCPRNCAEVTVKDIGLIGQDGSWQVVVGGAAGKHVRKADLLITVETTEEALDAAMIFFQYYRENGHYLERSYDFVERFGMEKIRKETVYAEAKVKKALLRRLQKSKAFSSDAWLEGQSPRTASQFVQIQPIENRRIEEVVIQ
jgi:nitrite reductase (NADH) large subunit